MWLAENFQKFHACSSLSHITCTYVSASITEIELCSGEENRFSYIGEGKEKGN